MPIAMHQLLLFPDAPPSEPAPQVLSCELQAEVVSLLLRGGSPQAVCQKLRLDPAAFCRTVEEDPTFCHRLRHVRELMTQNVVATVYAAALKGTPAAQALWLRTFPPPQFSTPSLDTQEETTDEFSAYSTEDLSRHCEIYSHLSYESEWGRET